MFGAPNGLLGRYGQPRGIEGLLANGLMGRGGIYGNPPMMPWEEDMLRRADEIRRRQGGILETVDAPPGQPASPPRPEIDPAVQDMLGNAPEEPKGFWKGGKKFHTKDAVAAALAIMGDAFANSSGSGRGHGFSGVKMLTDGLNDRREVFQKALIDYAKAKQVASLPGMTAREFAAYKANPDQWGSHMADALSTHQAAANLNPGDQRLYGNPNAGGSIYQAPTAAEQYAGSLGETAGTPGYRTALQDYTLKGSGPTAYGYDVALDDHRTANDRGMERLRQVGRASLRGQPTYRDLNPPPLRVGASRAGASPRKKRGPTATGPNGEKIEWNGSEWVPVR